MRLQDQQAALAAYRNPKGKRYEWDGTPEPGPSFEEREATRLQATAKAHAALNARYGKPNDLGFPFDVFCMQKSAEEITADIKHGLGILLENCRCTLIGMDAAKEPDQTAICVIDIDPRSGELRSSYERVQQPIKADHASFDPKTGDLSILFSDMLAIGQVELEPPGVSEKERQAAEEFFGSCR